VTVHGCAVKSAKLHQGHTTGSRDIQYGWILSGQTSYDGDRTRSLSFVLL